VGRKPVKPIWDSNARGVDKDKKGKGNGNRAPPLQLGSDCQNEKLDLKKRPSWERNGELQKKEKGRRENKKETSASGSFKKMGKIHIKENWGILMLEPSAPEKGVV